MSLSVTNIDLLSDWMEILKQILTTQMFDVSSKTNDEVAILYYSLHKRLISDVARKIHKSNGFMCPPEHQEGLSIIEDKIAKGLPLRAHQSRKLKRLEDKDGLLYDWGIFHLHLGTVIESDGFMNRTGPLLYAMFDSENAYLISIMEHGQWANRDLLRILHQNWPEKIDVFRIKGVLGVKQQLTDSEILECRKAGINVMIEVEPGVVYIGPGGGMTASKDSADAVNQMLIMKAELLRFEKTVQEDVEAFLTPLFKELKFIKEPNLRFRLLKHSAYFELWEENNNFSVLLDM